MLAVKVANDGGSPTGMDMAIGVVLEEEGAPSLEMVTEAVPWNEAKTIQRTLVLQQY